MTQNLRGVECTYRNMVLILSRAKYTHTYAYIHRQIEIQIDTYTYMNIHTHTTMLTFPGLLIIMKVIFYTCKRRHSFSINKGKPLMLLLCLYQ